MVEPHIVRPCDICGVVGFEECICSCSQCNNCEHVYCMWIHLKKVPEIWVCEACQSRNHDNTPNSNKWQKLKVSKVKFISADEAIMLTSGATAPSVKTHTVGRSNPQNTMARKDVRVASRTVGPKTSSFERGSNLIHRSHKCFSPQRLYVRDPQLLRELKETRILEGSQKQKLMTKQPMKAPTLASGCGNSRKKKAGNSMCRPSYISSPSKSATVISEKISGVAPTKRKFSREEQVLKCASEYKTSNREMEMLNKKVSCTSSPLKPCLPTDLPETISGVAPTKSKFSREEQVGALKSATEHKTPNREVEMAIEKVSCTSSPLTPCLPTKLPGDNAEGGNSDLLEKALPKIMSVTSASNLYAVDATWKGSFEILGSATLDRLYEGFQAHPPLIVHRRAYEFSKKMPAILQFKLLPRGILWAEIFQDDPPDENDVGLYIFPEDVERSKKDFACLLEAMNMDDSLMRINMDGVELLIFTSRWLHAKCQKPYEEYFLWGLFRCVKDVNTTKEQSKLPLVLKTELSADPHDFPPGFGGQC